MVFERLKYFFTHKSFKYECTIYLFRDFLDFSHVHSHCKIFSINRNVNRTTSIASKIIPHPSQTLPCFQLFSKSLCLFAVECDQMVFHRLCIFFKCRTKQFFVNFNNSFLFNAGYVQTLSHNQSLTSTFTVSGQIVC
jgi:hypothetical protein